MNYLFDFFLCVSCYILLGYIIAVLLMVLKIKETYEYGPKKREIMIIESKFEFRVFVIFYPVIIPGLIFNLIKKLLSKIPIPFYKDLND